MLQWWSIRTSKFLLCWPKILRKAHYQIYTQTKLFPVVCSFHVIKYSLCGTASTQIYCQRVLHAIIFHLACLARFYKNCLRPSGSTAHPPVGCHWMHHCQSCDWIRTWEPPRLNSLWAEGEDEDLVSQSSAIDIVNKVTRWPQQRQHMYNCLIMKLFLFPVLCELATMCNLLDHFGSEIKISVELEDLLKLCFWFVRFNGITGLSY